VEPALLSRHQPLGLRFLGLLFQSHCVECAARVESPQLGGLCLPCWKRLPWILGQSQGVRAVARFEGAWRNAIHAYKFYGRVSFRRPFASLLQDLAVDLKAEAVLGVPCGRATLKARGFDHVEAFARPLAKSLGLPYLKRGLLRVREGGQQARLKRQERLANAQDAYRASLDSRFHSKTLLLVDDVMTTGATLRACAQALRDSGAGKIESLVLASGN
jgi:ComF family protein